MWPINFPGDPEPNYRWSGVRLVNLQKNGVMGTTELSPAFTTLVLSQPPHFDKGDTQDRTGLSSHPPMVVRWATPHFALFETLHIVLALMGHLLCNKQFLFLFLNRAEKWRQNSRNESILKTPVATLQQNYRICSKHFTQEAFMNPLDKWAWEI